MTVIPKTDILFDDASIIKQLFGQNERPVSSANANCDCIGYSATDDEDVDTHQIAPAPYPAD